MPEMKMNEATCQQLLDAALDALNAKAKECQLSEAEAELYISYVGLTIGGLLAVNHGLPLMDFMRQARLTYQHYSRGGKGG